MRKKVLITGASRGIGRAIALNFAKNGYDIGVNYNTSDKAAAEVKKEILDLGVEAELFKFDVSDWKQCENLADAFIKRFGGVDVLVNNAGISLISPINDTSFEDWNRIINTDLSSAFYLSKSLLPYFIKSKSGAIINISSIWGVSGASCEVAYSTSKAGLVGFTQALAKELGPSGIRVNCISPGVIKTDMNKALDSATIDDLVDSTALCRLGEPEEIANIALFLASNSSSFITGQNIIADGGYI